MASQDHSVLEPPDGAVMGLPSSRLIPLASVEAGSGYDDLARLRFTLDGVQIVGLGEATHGSREFFQLKHRLVEFLVIEMGFRVFAIEASAAACVLIDDFVCGRNDDGAGALYGQGFWTWNTEEVLTMLDWMREYNRGRAEADQIRFMGVDAVSNRRGYDRLASILPMVDPTAARMLSDLPPPSIVGERAGDFETIEQKTFAVRQQDERNGERRSEFCRVRVRYRDLLKRMARHRERYRKLLSAEEVDEAFEALRLILQFIDGYAYDTPEHRRDVHMAGNVRRLVNRLPAGTRIALWAHNLHLIRTPRVTPVRSMGTLLSKWYGPQYYVFGFSFLEGGAQAWDIAPGKGGLREFHIAPSDASTLEGRLADMHEGNYLLDLRSRNGAPPVPNWLTTELRMRTVGACISSETRRTETVPVVPTEDYDAIAFVLATTRARPNPTIVNVDQGEAVEVT